MRRQAVVEALARGPRPGRQARTVALAACGGLLLVAGSAGLAALLDVPFRTLSKEPVETLGGDAYVGWTAHVGSLLWWAGGVAALLAGAVLVRRGAGRPARFLLAAGGLTAVLVADDLFLLHEAVYPRLGLPEELVYAAYGAGLLTIAARFWPEVARHGVFVVAAAMTFWGLSIGMDAVQEHLGVHLHVVEDGAKLVGVCLWSTFLVGAAVRELERPAPP